jgi:ABC-type dipeptide/oligopeptide/nickel transport system permease subunit
MTKRRFPIPTRRTVPRYEYAPPPRRRIRTDRVVLVALVYLVLSVAAVIAAPLLTPYDPLAMAPAQQFLPPSRDHLAGTDLFGRDVATRVLYGGRLSLAIGALAVLIAALPGTALGLLAGYYGRRVDRVIGWLVDVMLSFPSILLALTIVAALGSGAGNVAVAVGIANIPNYARLARGQVLSVRRRPYVRAAVAIGCTDFRILLRHIMPNILGPMLVLATLDVGWAILNTSALSFLGLGVQPPTPEWGAMLNEGRGYLRDAPWVTIAPGLAIALTVLAVNLLGDFLRDALDPRRHNRH